MDTHPAYSRQAWGPNEYLLLRSVAHGDFSRSSMSMREGIAVDPRCFDPYLSAGEAEARTQSGVAFDLQR